MAIHPTAVVDVRAEIHADAEIGAFAVIDGPVRIGAGTLVHAHAMVCGNTEIGRENIIHSFAAIGGAPQDLAYRGATSFVRIGDRNVFREGVTVHRGTQEGTTTQLGHDIYLMANAHVGHNCTVGDRVILANGAVLGGYVEVGERAFISGNCAVHQFCRVGRYALMRGLSRAARDVPPFCILDDLDTIRAINRVGMRRGGFNPQQIRAVHTAIRTLFFAHDNLRYGMAEVEAGPRTPEVDEILGFIRSAKRGVGRASRRPVRPVRPGSDASEE